MMMMVMMMMMMTVFNIVWLTVSNAALQTRHTMLFLRCVQHFVGYHHICLVLQFLVNGVVVGTLVGRQ